MPRLYVAADLPSLREYVAAGRIPADADRVLAPAEDEESEYAALMTAADLSTDLQSGAVRRRVVVVADLAAADPDDEIPWRRVVAVHADPAPRPVDADPDEDLSWYATQEIPALLEQA